MKLKALLIASLLEISAYGVITPATVLSLAKIQLDALHAQISNNNGLNQAQKITAMTDAKAQVLANIPYKYSKVRHDITFKANCLIRSFGINPNPAQVGRILFE